MGTIYKVCFSEPMGGQVWESKDKYYRSPSFEQPQFTQRQGSRETVSIWKYMQYIVKLREQRDLIQCSSPAFTLSGRATFIFHAQTL
jgi:hypothetical protein